MIKEEALSCIRSLPDNVDWNDIFYALYVVQKIEKGRQETREGKGMTIDEARKQLGIL